MPVPLPAVNSGMEARNADNIINPGEGTALILMVAPVAYIAPTAKSQQQPGALYSTACGIAENAITHNWLDVPSFRLNPFGKKLKYWLE